MKNLKIKSYCKINLTLRIIKKLKNGYHNIMSLITFCNLHDLISISEIKDTKDKINFSGSFRNGINKKSNTITKMLNLLRKNNILKKKFFKIIVKKNIPHGSGLGGGSSNAATLLKYLNYKLKLNITKNKMQKLANQIGFDVPINLEKVNTFLNGRKNKILRLNQDFNLNLIIVYPNIICSTKKIYGQKRKINPSKKYNYFRASNNKRLINFLKKEPNDLEESATKIYPKIRKVISFIYSLKGCQISRITGSGSACIGIFSNMKNAIYAKKLIKLKYPKYWCTVSKTI